MNAILAMLCPPLAVLRTGRPQTAVLTLALTLLFWLPGMAHAMLILSQDHNDRRQPTAGLELGVQESGTRALLSLGILMFAVVAAFLFWPAFQSRFITPEHTALEIPTHEYK